MLIIGLALVFTTVICTIILHANDVWTAEHKASIPIVATLTIVGIVLMITDATCDYDKTTVREEVTQTIEFPGTTKEVFCERPVLIRKTTKSFPWWSSKHDRVQIVIIGEPPPALKEEDFKGAGFAQ